jgi:hypothetical protein
MRIKRARNALDSGWENKYFVKKSDTIIIYVIPVFAGITLINSVY